MSDAFIPPRPERPDHRRAALEDALARLEEKLVAIALYVARKREEADDRIGTEHALGTQTGLLVARDLLRAMLVERRNA
jgi:hypothetical protein